MRTQATLADMTRMNWAMIAVLGVVALVLFILAEVLGEISTAAEFGRLAPPGETR